MIRSGLWQPEAWPDTSKLPSFAEMLVAHAKLANTVDEMQADDRYKAIATGCT